MRGCLAGRSRRPPAPARHLRRRQRRHDRRRHVDAPPYRMHLRRRVGTRAGGRERPFRRGRQLHAARLSHRRGTFGSGAIHRIHRRRSHRRHGDDRRHGREAHGGARSGLAQTGRGSEARSVPYLPEAGGSVVRGFAGRLASGAVASEADSGPPSHIRTPEPPTASTRRSPPSTTSAALPAARAASRRSSW